MLQVKRLRLGEGKCRTTADLLLTCELGFGFRSNCAFT